jgi:hypothetical protein
LADITKGADPSKSKKNQRKKNEEPGVLPMAVPGTHSRSRNG